MTGRRLVACASRWLGCDQDVVEPTAHTLWGRAPVQSLDQLIETSRGPEDVYYEGGEK